MGLHLLEGGGPRTLFQLSHYLEGNDIQALSACTQCACVSALQRTGFKKKNSIVHFAKRGGGGRSLSVEGREALRESLLPTQNGDEITQTWAEDESLTSH